MSDANHDEVLSEFTGVTGIDKERAKFYLESANWDLSVNIHSKCASQCNCVSLSLLNRTNMQTFQSIIY